MKKSLFSLLSALTAIGSLSPTVFSIPTVRAETAIQANALAYDNDIDDATDDLLESIAQMRRTVQKSSRIPGSNKKLDGKLENLENGVRRIRNMNDRRASNYEYQRAVRDLKDALLSTATEFHLSTLAVLPNVQKDWYEVATGVGALNHAVNGNRPRGPRQPDPRQPDPRQPTPGRRPRIDRLAYEFRGSVEGSPVYFFGATAKQLLDGCRAYVNSTRLPSIYNVKDETGAVIYSSSRLNGEELCGIAALNATIKGYEQYGYSTMTLESTRIRLNNALSDEQLADLLASVTLPANSVYNLKIRGGSYSTSRRSADQQKAIIQYNFGQDWGRYSKEGTIEGVPFQFFGAFPTDIQTQCVDFFNRAMGGISVYNVKVGGKTYSGSRMDAQSACMTVMAAQ